MVTSTYRSGAGAEDSVRGESIPAIIWGFTPRTMSWQVRAISSLVDGRAPGRVWSQGGGLGRVIVGQEHLLGLAAPGGGGRDGRAHVAGADEADGIVQHNKDLLAGGIHQAILSYHTPAGKGKKT